MKEIEELRGMIFDKEYTRNEVNNKLLEINKIYNKSEKERVELEGRNHRQELYIAELQKEIAILKTMINSIVD